MQCAITGEIAEEPVVNTKTGHVYERRIIERYIETHGVDPITGDPLSKEDLLLVQSGPSISKPRTPAATSVPGMLSLFQSEWDSLMLETFELKKHVEQVRQELSHALYQHDAACRVIARLIKERDAARNELARLGVPADGDDVGDSAGITEETKEVIRRTAEVLRSTRKKRDVPEDAASTADMEGFHADGEKAVHKAAITCMDIAIPKQTVILSGDATGRMVVFDTESRDVIAHMEEHTGAIRAVRVHPDRNVLFSASVDKTCKVWKGREGGRGYDVIHSVGTFDASVNGVVVHPTKDYFAACGANASWGFYDLALGTTLAVLKDTDVDDFTSMDVHPDGLLFGFGTSGGQLRLWDIQNQSHAATLSGPSDEIKNISFSENGYYVCVSHENSVQVWDLRKLKTVFSMPVVEGSRYVNGRFDSYGRALGVVSSKNLNIFTAAKKIDSICSIEMAGVELTAGVFANKSSLFVSGCTDGRYAFFSL